MASRCTQFGVLYLGVPEDWGVPGHKMFPLWRILCRPRHFVARGDVFMAANPTAPHQETSVTHCQPAGLNWPKQRKKCSIRFFPALFLNHKCANASKSFPSWLKCTSWYKSLAQRGTRFSNFDNNVSTWKLRQVQWCWKHFNLCISITLFVHLLTKLLSWLHFVLLFPPGRNCIAFLVKWMKMCRHRIQSGGGR